MKNLANDLVPKKKVKIIFSSHIFGIFFYHANKFCQFLFLFQIVQVMQTHHHHQCFVCDPLAEIIVNDLYNKQKINKHFRSMGEELKS